MTVGSPQSTLCGLPKSGQESPNGGASKGTSPPSSPLEQRPADPWELLYEAAGQVARMRSVTNSIPVPTNAYGFNGHGGFAPPARKPSPPPVAPPATKAPAGGYYHPLAHLVSQRQIQAAQVRWVLGKIPRLYPSSCSVPVALTLSISVPSSVCSSISSSNSSCSSCSTSATWPWPRRGARARALVRSPLAAAAATRLSV